MTRSLLAILGLSAAACAWSQPSPFRAYVGALGSDSAILAWGTTAGANTIGRSSLSHGEAAVSIAGRKLNTRQNWLLVSGLAPDTAYPYKIELNGHTIAESSLRTWPARDNKLVFFVIGDFGNGHKSQYDIAAAMWTEYERRNASGNPVRFILTVGDNIYGDVNTFIFGMKNTGSEDSDWGPKFFDPYRRLIERIPFYPTLGNHDGNETENRADLTAYLDNFFFPGGKPARWYQFNYAGLADFFGLDTTMITETGRRASNHLATGPQFQWMKQALPAARAPWKIPYFHHPPFNAGPRHAASYRDLRHWMELFESTGVKVTFHGHEHNFQVSEVNARSHGIMCVISGSGGELRSGDIRRKMAEANIAAHAAQHQFLVVEIKDRTMTITPVSYEPMRVHDPQGRPVKLPFTVELPAAGNTGARRPVKPRAKLATATSPLVPSSAARRTRSSGPEPAITRAGPNGSPVPASIR